MQQNLRRWGLGFLVLYTGLGLASLGPVHAQDIFEVSDVLVDETAASSDAARDTALAKGQDLAWRLLVERLVLISDQDRAIRAGSGQLTNLVRSFGVDDERVSSERYMANLVYRFNPVPVRQLLRAQNIAFAETPGPTLVVLPIVVRGGVPDLWSEGDNSWLQAWQNAPPGHGLIGIRAPFGDLADLLSIDAKDALEGNWNLMQPLAERYGADGVLVASIDIGATAVLELTQYTEPVGRQVGLLGSPLVSTSPEGLASAVALADRSLNEVWKQANLLTLGSQDEITVDISLDGMGSWLDVRRVLTNTAIVQDVETLVLSAKNARVSLSYLGDIARLQSTLRQEGLALVEQGDIWLIYPL